MSIYYVYMLQCKDNSLYTGITTDVERRLQEHKNGKGGNYTRSYVAEKIVYTEKCKNRSEAQKIEAKIKKLSRAQKLEIVKTIKTNSSPR